MKTAFCFDLDGTLTREEILPQIANHVGLSEEIELLTKITMQGLIPFTKSFKLRVKLLTQIPINAVRETVMNILVDEHLAGFIRENKENCFIVTGNLDVWVQEFIAVKFGCKVYSSIAEYEGDKLIDISTILDKRDAITDLRMSFDRIVCVGDGMNDCAMFEASDIGIAFGGVHEPVYSLIQLSNFVSYDSKSLVKLLLDIKNSSYEN